MFWEQYIDEIEISPSPFLDTNGCCIGGGIWHHVERLSEILSSIARNRVLPRVTPFTLEQCEKMFFTSRKRDKDRWEISPFLRSHGEASYLSNNDESKEVKWQLNFDRHCIGCCISISWLSICHNWANSDVLAIVLCSPNVKQFSEWSFRNQPIRRSEKFTRLYFNLFVSNIKEVDWLALT